jgi:hypothetical protein
MNIDLIDIEDDNISVVDTDGNSYTINIQSEDEVENQLAEAILEICYTIMENVPPDDADGSQPLPYYSEDDEY